ncbi:MULTISPECIES: BON domain-containing protein [unclassified Rhizobium]|uniref:BON domain-containing protein n=1 Tax=unclassified Rhizobium TaxID=2613769 RepID=UPI0016175C2C|nr:MULTISPECIES: BON domain-containing protein [unclassified Rhizobium]MBB3541344.1 osmotically-inducible protein OsmY [Rhizobium sp. BK399]MCS3740068.1 osmotically-inducible protein OsmY [Rhizobium sp. BK661]MCS4091982.1 osmotically-inducible protein OsmY [Rhizobium sp. BK176]
MPGKDKELSREEDYRDFEERNIDDGWPYADKGQTGADSENGAYGEASRREPSSGFRVDGVDEDGNENPFRDSLRPGLIDRDDSDELEAKVAENLENIPDVDVGGIEVHADGHVVTLEGEVETIGMARKVELAALAVDGVHHVRNKIETTGVDSHIPTDD